MRGRPLALNASAIALVAALAEQIQHEVTHGVAAVLVGARWEWLSLFATASRWPGEAPRWGAGIIAGSAAVLNVAAGLLAAALLGRRWLVRRPGARLFVLYFAAYSLLAGFGYWMIDALFYRPKPELGDWKKVIDLLGGGWGVRAAIGAAGVAGVLVTYFWLPRAALAFAPAGASSAERFRLGRTLLMVPYFVVNTIALVLSLRNPLGANGVVLVAMKYWLGFMGLFWGAFIIRREMPEPPPEQRSVPPSERPLAGWIVAAILLALVGGLVLLPRFPR